MDASTMILSSRLEAGLSQRELAKLAGTSPAAVSLYETGKRVPRIDTLTRLIAATGSSIEMRVRDDADNIDIAANSRALEAGLELAGHLPQRHSEAIAMPPFRDLARH